MAHFSTLASPSCGRSLNASALGSQLVTTRHRLQLQPPEPGLSVEGASSMQVQRIEDAVPALAPLRTLADLANAWRALLSNRLHAYRPEKHYMRGPGPKWHEKHARDRTAAQR